MKKTLLVLLCAILALTMLFSACSSGSDSDSSYSGGSEVYPGEVGDAGDKWVSNEDSLVATPGVADRKIIKTYEITAETREFDAALTELNTRLSAVGGYVETGSTSDSGLGNKGNSSRFASYTLRIPADKTEEFMSGLGELLHITRNYSTVDDVSDTYYSVEATLEELIAERDSLLAIQASLDAKEDYSFWLTVQERLSAVKQQIAVYQRQLMNYDSKVAYSTVHLSLCEVKDLTDTEEPGFWIELGDAFVGGFEVFLSVLQGLALAAASLFPFLLIIGAAVAIILVASSRARKKKRAKLQVNTEKKD